MLIVNKLLRKKLLSDMDKFIVIMEVDFNSKEFNCNNDNNIIMKALENYISVKIRRYAMDVKVNSIEIKEA